MPGGVPPRRSDRIQPIERIASRTSTFDIMQFSALALMLALAPASALLVSSPVMRQPLSVAAARRSTELQMGEQSTRRQNEWKFVKGINDYGKEQTYMFLAEQEGSQDDFMGAPVVDAGDWSFFFKPYFLVLFAPFVLASLAVLTQ